MTKNRSSFIRIVSMLLVAVAMLAFTTACGGDTEIDRKEATEIVDGAMAKLETNAHTVTVSSYISSTDFGIAEAIGENRSTVQITIDGDSYAFTEKRGTERIEYLFVDDVLYVNESFIGIITKQSFAVAKTAGMTDDEYRDLLVNMQNKKNENYENFVGRYLEDIILTDYEGFSRDTDRDGRLTLVLGPIKESVAERMQDELGNWTEAFDSIKESYMDRDRSTVTVKLDEEGRPESITTIYALAIVFQDDYRALVSFVNEMTYSYENSKLATPSDAKGYIDMEEGYLGLLNQSFTVTSDVITKAEADSTVIAKLQNVFGQHNIVRVDKDNFEVKYPFVGAEDAALKYSAQTILVGDVMFVKDEYDYSGEISCDLSKYKLTAAGLDTYYKNVVMVSFIPAFARDFVDINVTKDDDGNSVITCSGLTESYFYQLYDSFNVNYTGGKVLVPQETGCTYTVVIDPSGRYLKSELAVWVTVLDDAKSQIVVGEEYYCVRRTFDYAEAEAFYKDAAEGESWVRIPEDQDKYQDPYGAFN